MSHRILQIVDNVHPTGVGGQLLILAEGLPRDEFEVHVCTMDQGGYGAERLEAAETPMTEIGARANCGPVAFGRLYRHIRRLQPELVHTCGPVASTLGRAAALAAGVKTMVVSRPREETSRGMLGSWIDRQLNARTQQTIVTTPDVRDQCLTRGIAEETITEIASGVPAAKESSLTRDEALLRLGLPTDTWLVGAIGPLEPEERLKDLLWVSQLINMLYPNLRLVVFGEGPQRNLLERYRGLLDGQDFIWLPGDRDDLPDLLPHVNVLWHTPSYVSQPMAILEAMAAGVPVMASDIAGHRDLVLSGQTGFLLPVNIRRAWTKAAKRLYEDQELARRLGQQGRERVQVEFRSEQMIELHVMLYRSLLDG